MAEYKVPVKFDLGEEVALLWRAQQGGHVETSKIVAIIPLIEKDNQGEAKMSNHYVLEVGRKEVHGLISLESLSKVAQPENKLATLKEARKEAAAYLRDRADRTEKGELDQPLEEKK